MLQEIELFNFKCHKHLTFSFSPNITTLVGRTGAGKTAVLTALYWVFFNKPTGTRFIRNGQEKTLVRIRIDNHTIERVRGKTKNYYKIDGKILKSFHTDVPEEVLNITRIGEPNVQRQFSLPFWISDSPLEVSRQLNTVVNLELIDNILSESLRIITRKTIEVKTKTEELEELKKRKEELSFVQEAKEEFQNVKTLFESLQTLQKTISSLEEILSDFSSIQKKQKEYVWIEKIATALSEQAEQITQTSSQIRSLESQLYTLKQKTEEQNRLSVQINELEEKIKELTKDRCPLCLRKMT